MKKFLSVMMTFIVLFLPGNFGVFAQEEETMQDITSSVRKVKPVLKLAAKFSVPIVILAAIGGASAYAYHRYKNPTLKLSGEVSAKEVDELFENADNTDWKDREVTIQFEDAVIKPNAFRGKTFKYKVLFSGKCTIMPCACENTVFGSDIEIKGSLTENSSLSGARFEKSVIVDNAIPKKLFFGSQVILSRGNRYRLPEKVEITCDGTDKSKEIVKNYLEEVYFK